MNPLTSKTFAKVCPQTRRQFLGTCAATLATAAAKPFAAVAANAESKAAQQVPLKIGIRAATMKMVGDMNVVRTAAEMAGINGVELQVIGGSQNLHDLDVVREYKRESDRWDLRIPSIAGVWEKGVNIGSSNADEYLRKSIRTAELLGSRVVLVAFFDKNAPDVSREESYGPVVANLRKVAQAAADAGVILGLENSLSPADNIKLLDLVGHPAVRIYYDLFNMSTYGHTAEAVPGVKLFGRDRICAVHVKNGNKLIEAAGPIDWAAAFAAFNEIGYEGWFTYETSHKDLTACIADTAKNNAFLRKNLKMPAI
ncbi:MAG TPA: sugar phosphate isomerase/epimerase family protein [Candidatus Dormibacteraeota bacterium]|nr:sugar phosphate isomerase/epimerase family protein [Candidatus Dormibacteraeota bacterium]